MKATPATPHAPSTAPPQPAANASQVPSPHFLATVHDSAAATDGPERLSNAESGGNRLEQTLAAARRYLLGLQQADGHWCGELEGDSILQSEYILLMAWLDRLDEPDVSGAARYLLQQQMPGGGWNQYPGGQVDISASVKAYFALKLTGHDVDSPAMRRARSAILDHGGADAVNSFTRFYLALLGQIHFDHCPAVPPEAVLLPAWSPLNMYRVSAWSRTIFVPLAIVWAFRPRRELPAERGIGELFHRPPEQWPPLRCPGLDISPSGRRWDRFFRLVDQTLKWCQRWRITPLRRRALRSAEAWMIQRLADSDGLGAIFPPIIWSIVALRCLGYADSSAELRECHQQLSGLMIRERDTVRLQPCKSPVWDTALSLRALAASHSTTASRPALPAGSHAASRPDSASDASQAVRRGVAWLLDREVRRPGDWSVNVRAEPSGWFFEYRNAFYPDVDDTIMVLMALRENAPPATPRGAIPSLAATSTEPGGSLQAVAEACERGRRWILAMQNRDGGWGAFDKDNDHEFLCHVPFADHNAMIDPSTPDITGRVLEALGQCGMVAGNPVVDRAVAYLRQTQESDGAWPGRWGVNYIYGTWQVLVGLAEVQVGRHDPAMTRGAAWLLKHQLASGGWGESADSYVAPSLRGQGPATPSQTAWAILGLLAAGHGKHDAVRRGVHWLIDQQRADGSWLETEFTGTGFPRVFYLRYHMYPQYFPLLALGQYARLYPPVSGSCSF